MFEQAGHTTNFGHHKNISLGVAYVSRLITKTQNNQLYILYVIINTT